MNAAEEKPLRVLYDGACPLCQREARFWKRLDRGRQRVVLEDIAATNFDPQHYGLSAADVQQQIHAITPEGDVIRGMEVFRKTYAALGWGWLLAPTAWPVLRSIFDHFYAWFARNRHRITRRKPTCESGACGVSE